MYDVAIVGAGPGGLIAAKTAAENGLKVVLIEKRKDISQITRACCEQFIMDENYSGDTIEVGKDEVFFTKNNFRVKYTGPQMKVTDKYYISPSGRTIHFAYEDKRPIVIKFDKGFLLQELLVECTDMGVAYIPSTVVYDAEDTGSEVKLYLTCQGKHSVISTKKVIAADGVNTGVAEALGMNKERQLFATAFCIVYYMEGIKVFDKTALKTYFGRNYQGLAPVMIGPSIHGEDVGYVICTGNKKYSPPEIFKNITQKGALAWAFEDAKLIKPVGCTLKTYSAMPVPWNKNAIVIGDAAAFVEVETQGALMCGYRAANAVVKELSGEKGFKVYTKWWQDSFEFNSSDVMRVAQGFALVPKYSDEELDYLFGLVEGERLQGTYNQYRSPEIMWNAILNHSSKIKSERSELYEKITGSQSCLSDML